MDLVIVFEHKYTTFIKIKHRNQYKESYQFLLKMLRLLLFCIMLKKNEYYGPVRLQRFSQRMPTFEKLMQNVGIRLIKVERKKNQRKPFPERIQSVCITY